jgi:hypothetical protein
MAEYTSDNDEDNQELPPLEDVAELVASGSAITHEAARRQRLVSITSLIHLFGHRYIYLPML